MIMYNVGKYMHPHPCSIYQLCSSYFFELTCSLVVANEAKSDIKTKKNAYKMLDKVAPLPHRL